MGTKPASEVRALMKIGRTRASTAPETAAEAAAWLAELITALELSRPIVLGHSFGGAVALELGFAKRVDVGALVLVSSGARLRVASVILDAAAKATADAPLPLGFAFGSDTDRGVVEAYGELAGQTPPDATLADWQACDGFDRLTALGELDARVLVVHGDRDQLTPVKYQRKLEQAIAGAERVEVAGAGHMLPWERPRELAEAVRAALG